ncbi:MAG: HAD family hydrolase [Candidatus Dormibacteria bacterium]|jgi:hypothetical protein
MIDTPVRPPGTVRLIATDVDGTVLLPEAPWISDRTLAAIRQAMLAGMSVLLATGRRPQTLKPLASALGVMGPAICCNGALICDLDTMAVLSDVRMSADQAAAVIRDVRAAIPGVCFAWACGLSGGCDADYLATIPAERRLMIPSAHADPRGFLLETVDDIEAHIASGVTRIVVKHPAWPVTDVLAAAAAAAGDRAMVTWSHAPFAEIHAPAVSKAAALAQLCAAARVDRSDVVAIGDGHNDLDMLLWAGRGIAMGNAHPAVLDAVPERTHSNAEDGFAAVLESLLIG